MGPATPNFFIIGAPKSGTTSLQSYLDQHPEICMPCRNEPNFFGRDLDHGDRPGSWTEYQRLFSGRPEKWVGDKSVWYLYSTTASREIYEFNPEARIIAIFRQPVEQLRSLHQHFVFSGEEDERDFEKALELQNARKSGFHIPSGASFPGALQYKEVPRYTHQIQRFLDIFPREQVLILIFDELKQNPEKTVRQVFEFLGVSTDVTIDYGKQNEGKEVRSLWLRNFLKRSQKAWIFRWIPGRLRQWMGHILRAWNFRSAKGPPPVRPSLLVELQREFEPEIQRFEEVTGYDVGSWRECPK